MGLLPNSSPNSYNILLANDKLPLRVGISRGAHKLAQIFDSKPKKVRSNSVFDTFKPNHNVLFCKHIHVFFYI